MNVLLLLSALLSALTGVGSSSRAVEPAAAIAARPIEEAVAPRAVVPVQQPRVAVPLGRTALGRTRVVLAAAPAAREPLFLLRRRE